MYRLLFRLVLRRMDPERAHELAFALISGVGRVPGLAPFLHRAFFAPGPGAETEVFGRRLPGPFGLAAGFDKEARAVLGLSMLGFGFVEIGTVTAQAQPGNDKPRLWRIVEDRALRNRMGFNNHGAVAAAARLKSLRRSARGRAVVVGVNIGKTKVTSAARAAQDYAFSASQLAPFADYLVVNVSSPNTPGLRDLQSVDALRPILAEVRLAADTAVGGRHVPLLVKIAPDLADDDVDAVAGLALELGLDGVVAVNTTIAHDLGPGGLSGPVLLERGTAVVRRLRAALGERAVIIGVGGISSGEDAQRYLDAGATIVQGYTGLVYEGPWYAARVNRYLASRRAAREPSPEAP